MKIRTIAQILKYGCFRLLGKVPNHSIDLKINKTRHGSDYGGWVVAHESIKKDSVVYSFGIGTDISFDLAMIAQYGTKVYGFDPTPGSQVYVEKTKTSTNFVFYPYGIASDDKQEKFYVPANPDFISHSKTPSAPESPFILVEMKKLSTIMKELNHSQVDILKMDIEGFEYEVIKNILQENLNVKQILVEFHHDMYTNITKADTNEIVALLRKAGYKIFHISNSVREYSFIKDEATDD